jgi:hypothetical protein
MRSSLTAVLLFLCLTISGSVSAQQSASAGSTSGSQSSQEATLLQQALTALTGGVQIKDVTLTGTASVPNHPGAPTGNIVLVATANGRSQVTLTSSAGVDTEADDYSAGPHASQSSGPGGVVFTTPPQSLPAIHPAWFFPAFIMATVSSSAQFGVSGMGQNGRNGAAVPQLTLWRQQSIPIASQHDFFFDPTTSLPASMTFRVRAFNPNNPVALVRAIPTAPPLVEEEVRYADYRQVQGVPVPFHIQLYIQGMLACDIQLSSATINTGVAIAAVN